ncbi:protein TIFY 11a-like [Oryza brachyantha]|uniref:protein TIFY 11a-like n=1 Tax=Oryza brachyantha TaxID=4533 RepID=UPI001ADA90E9|nr:protein TIFY 11a-like [Oryza brachyantha]
MASTVPVTRRFTIACGLLSQFVKASSPQPSSSSTAAAAGLMATAPAATPFNAAAVQEPRCEPAAGREQQFTIFYDGRVVVIDRCAPATAADLIRYAAAAQGTAPEAPAPALVDMPIARKASLQRFLAKRKDRATDNARPSYGPPAKKAKAPEEKRDDWLALGSLGDMHSR